MIPSSLSPLPSSPHVTAWGSQQHHHQQSPLQHSTERSADHTMIGASAGAAATWAAYPTASSPSQQQQQQQHRNHQFHSAHGRSMHTRTSRLSVSSSSSSSASSSASSSPTPTKTSMEGSTYDHMDTSVIIYGHPAYRTFRNVWMLEEMELPYSHVMVSPRTSSRAEMRQYKDVNPHLKIPALRMDMGRVKMLMGEKGDGVTEDRDSIDGNENGSFFVRESIVINTFLGDTFQSPLVPRPGTMERLRYDELCFFVATELDSQALYIHRKHSDLHSIYGASDVAVEAAKQYFQRHLGIQMKMFARSGTKYILGNEFTAADILLGHILVWADSIGWLAENPRPSDLAIMDERSKKQAQVNMSMHAYFDDVTSRPAFKRTQAFVNDCDGG